MSVYGSYGHWLGNPYHQPHDPVRMNADVAFPRSRFMSEQYHITYYCFYSFGKQDYWVINTGFLDFVHRPEFYN
jgi:hypothetical protein